MSYNVLREPWIPMSDGHKYSLWDCLEHAHELERVSCASAPETYAVHRFLCAFVMDALQLPNKSARLALLKQGRFDMTVFEAYVGLCEQEGVSFDLFDEMRPFMQAQYDENYDKKVKSVALIIPEYPSGNNHMFFEHVLENTRSVSADDAFIGVLSIGLYSTSGTQGPSSINGAPCLYTIVRGENLFENILLNILSIKESGNLPYGIPAWRDMTVIEPTNIIPTVGLLEGLTWQARRVLLVKGHKQQLSQVYFTAGKSFGRSPLWRDPHVPYSKKDDSYTSIKPQSGRSLWRDLGGLAVSKENRFGRQPQVIAALPENWPLCKISVMGLVTDRATLVDTVYEEMLIPSAILNDEDKGDTLHRDLDFVEEVCRLVGRALGEKFPNSFRDDLQNNFLLTVRTFVFGTYFDTLSQCESDESFSALQKQVEEQVLQSLKNMFGHLSLRLGFDAKNIILQSEVQKEILTGYYKLRRKRNDE